MPSALPSMHKHAQFNYPNSLDSLETLAGDLEVFFADTPYLIASYPVNLCLDEAFTNVVNYGYKPKQEDIISLELSLEGCQLKITLVDGAKPYDPTLYPDVDPDALCAQPLEDQRPGGLGIHFIRKYMDSVDYQYLDGKNHLSLTKDLSASAA